MKSRQAPKNNLLIWVAAILILAAAGYFVFNYFSKLASIPEIGESYPIEGAAHVAEGTKVEYHTNPPSSGAHNANPARWGAYDKELSDGNLVHNLEHGGVWISYKPSIPDATKEKLRAIAKGYRSKVIFAPRAANDKDIAMASWGRVYKFDLNADGGFNENAVRNYITKYKNTGPEKIPD